jgi:hypothetical protein
MYTLWFTVITDYNDCKSSVISDFYSREETSGHLMVCYYPSVVFIFGM